MSRHVISSMNYLVEHVSTQENLEGVVVNQRVFETERFSVSHKQRTNNADPRQIDENEGCCRYWSVHQRELLHSRI